jgi:hypothetical protein
MSFNKPLLSNAGNAHNTPPLGTSRQVSNSIEAPFSCSPTAAWIRSSTLVQAVPSASATLASIISRADLLLPSLGSSAILDFFLNVHH